MYAGDERKRGCDFYLKDSKYSFEHVLTKKCLQKPSAILSNVERFDSGRRDWTGAMINKVNM